MGRYFTCFSFASWNSISLFTLFYLISFVNLQQRFITFSCLLASYKFQKDRSSGKFFSEGITTSHGRRALPPTKGSGWWRLQSVVLNAAGRSSSFCSGMQISLPLFLAPWDLCQSPGDRSSHNSLSPCSVGKSVCCLVTQCNKERGRKGVLTVFTSLWILEYYIFSFQ